MGMMISTMNNGWYATNDTSMSEPLQPFGGMADTMAAAKDYVAPGAAIILGEAKICCEASQEMIPLV